MPQSPQHLTLYHSQIFGLLHVKRSYHLYTKYRWPEVMCPPVDMRNGTVVPLRFQCKNEIGSGQCLFEEGDLRY